MSEAFICADYVVQLARGTGKSLSEALIFASTNPQYDDRLLIAHENCKLRIPAEHVVYTTCSADVAIFWKRFTCNTSICGVENDLLFIIKNRFLTDLIAAADPCKIS